MRTQAIVLAVLAAAPSTLAHTIWSVLYVDGVSQGDGAGLRMRQDPKLASYPLVDYNSDDMACNVDGTKGVAFVNPVKDGSTLTFEMRSWPDDPSKESLDRGHYGPCAVYLKKVSSAIDDKAAGDGWFKLMDDGYHADTDTWCTDRLIDNKGRLSVALPKGLEGGYYLARPEVVALHNATNGGAQFYTGCAQIFLESSGTLVPESTVAIPGPEYVTPGQASVQFNIYVGKNAEYQVPGPAIANFTHAAGTASSAQTVQKEGLVPAGCIAQNANWCGKEVTAYTDEQGCWASGEDCWTQGKKCWAEAPPTGGKVCELWNAKCEAMNDACRAKNFNGPPNKGKVITPKRETIDIGLIIKPVGGGNVDDSAPTPAPAPQAPKSSSVAAPKVSSSPPAAPLSAYEPKSSLVETPSATAPAASFKETPTFSSSVPLLSFVGGVYDIPSPTPTPASTIAVPTSEYATAPKPTPVAVDTVEVVTNYKVEVVTEVAYVTVAVPAGGYKHHRGHRRHF
ncbi:hypothetical protein BU23DRAFT_33891 [Bimuria novae-zelandiae CBS 107.79]|uniref:AA9 family lytic polysaccharide monooxygenase n=1 Tax=Bimuria novae-zelandiae CBS 107.79 TaxID=1447943 RepID=A0A6A5UKN2_9PLEO|nr:hypothetical protein BU23DRAFT_33891 [Bimuria novae-zelandiae CBS 107.79]